MSFRCLVTLVLLSITIPFSSSSSPTIPNLSTLRLPLPNNKTLTLLLLGTAHISLDSSSAVSNVMTTYEPDYVCLELCHERAPALLEEELRPPPDPPAPGPKLSVPKTNAILGLIASLQSSYALGQNVTVGVDFKAALSHVYHATPRKSQVILLDRPVSLTISRLITSLSPLSKARLVFSLLWQCIMARFNKKSIALYMHKALSDGTLLQVSYVASRARSNATRWRAERRD